MAPSLTAEIFTIPLDGQRYLIYAPLRRVAFVANARMVNGLADLKAGAPGSRIDSTGEGINFLRGLGLVDGGEEAWPITVYQGEPQPTTLTLLLTTACNLRCTYCYAASGETPRTFMAFSVARRGIDYVAGNALRLGRGQFDIAFHGGGEPTLNWRTLTRSLTYARDRADDLGLTVTAGAATNGVLNDSRIDWIIAHLDGVSLSIDGLPSVHDRHRPMANGKGSSDRVIHTLRRFDAAGFRYGLRLTVTGEEIPSLPDSVEFLCRHFNPRSIQVEPVYRLGRGQAAASAEGDDFIAAFRSAQGRARSHGQDISFSAARLDTLANHFCSVTQDNFCLTPDGNVTACYEAFTEDCAAADIFFYGEPDPDTPGYRFHANRLDHQRRQSVQHRPYCQGCFAKWHCAGDCYHKAYAAHGLDFMGTPRCDITRELIKDQILGRIAESGGLLWHEPPAAASPPDRYLPP